MENPDARVYCLIGEEGFERLTQGFYARVAKDDILLPMYRSSDMVDLEGARLRLRDFLIFRFGGPSQYIERRGHPKLRLRHQPFSIDRAARDRWVALMEASLAEARLHPEATEVLRGFFETTATLLINRGAPEGGAGFAGSKSFPVTE